MLSTRAFVGSSLAGLASGLLLALSVPALPVIGEGLAWLSVLGPLPLLFLVEAESFRNRQPRGFARRTSVSEASQGHFLLGLFCALGFAGVIWGFAGLNWLPDALGSLLGVHAGVAWGAFASVLILLGLYLLAIISPFLLNAFRKSRASSGEWPVWALAVVAAAIDTSLRQWLPWSLGQTLASFAGFSQLAAVVGEPGLTFFPIFFCGVIARRLSASKFALPAVAFSLGLVFVVAAIASGFGIWRLAKCDTELLTMDKTRIGGLDVQGAPPLDPRRRGNRRGLQVVGFAELLQKSNDLFTQGNPDLIVWPLGVLQPNFFTEEEEFIRLRSESTALGVPILVSTVETAKRDSPYEPILAQNIAALVRPDGSVSGKYFQQVLSPLIQSFPLRKQAVFLQDWWPEEPHGWRWMTGPLVSSLPYHPDFRVLPLLAFDVFGRGAAQAAVTGVPSSLFVVMADLSWTTSEIARGLILAAARFRAIEERRSVVVVGNGGPYAAFDPSGRRVVAQNGVLSVPASTELRRMVSLYHVFGPAFLTICLGIASLTLIVRSFSGFHRSSGGHRGSIS